MSDFAHLMIEPSFVSGRPTEEWGGVEQSQDRNISIISIHGPISHRQKGGLFGFLFGRTPTYENIQKRFQEALYDEAVCTIIFDIDSPGGEVAGCFDLVDEIYSARGAKPIYAISNEHCHSAAYAIASAADKIYLNRTSSLGSIGVLATYLDRSRAEEKAGLKFTTIYAGDRKDDFSPHGPLSKEAYQAAQASIDQKYSLFCTTVARNRGLSEQAIRNTEAAIFHGQGAVDIGLADEVISYVKLMEKFKNRGESMTLKEELQALLKGKLPKEIASAMAAVKFIPADASQKQVEQMKEIIGLCELAGISDLSFVSGMISDGLTTEQAREKILQKKADASNNNQIFSTVSATGIGETNPLLADAKKRAGKDGE